MLLTGETAFGPGKLFKVKKNPQDNRKPSSGNENKCRYTKFCLIIGKLKEKKAVANIANIIVNLAIALEKVTTVMNAKYFSGIVVFDCERAHERRKPSSLIWLQRVSHNF